MSGKLNTKRIFDSLNEGISSKYLLLPIFFFLAVFFVYPVVSMLFISFFDREGSSLPAGKWSTLYSFP